MAWLIYTCKEMVSLEVLFNFSKVNMKKDTYCVIREEEDDELMVVAVVAVGERKLCGWYDLLRLSSQTLLLLATAL